MWDKMIDRIFYSRILRKKRLDYYYEAYQQGKFDNEMDKLYAKELEKAYKEY